MTKQNKNFLSFFFGGLVLLLSLYATTLLLVPNPVMGEGLVPACGESGACGFCDIVNVFVTLGRWLVTGGAGIGLLLIVWAGVGMATSGGNAEKTGAAKKQILGVIIGLGMVLAAFQFVVILISMIVTPSRLATFQESQNPSEESNDVSSLKSLLGVPWWTICSIEDLRAKQGQDTTLGSTAHCRYWGDNTACDREGSGSNVCCRGECKPGPCIAPAVTAVQRGTQTLEGKSNLQSEEAVRAYLEAGGVKFWRTSSCPVGNTTGDGCTNVVGLSKDLMDKLIRAAQDCNCITISGGTEPGHLSHGPGLDVVDIDTTLSNFDQVTAALRAQGIGYNGDFGPGYTCEYKGRRVDCPTDGWVHVED